MHQIDKPMGLNAGTLSEMMPKLTNIAELKDCFVDGIE